MSYLTDATYVVDFLRGQAHAHSTYPTLIQNELALSIVTHMELWEGIYGDRDPKAAERRLRSFLRPMRLPFTQRVS